MKALYLLAGLSLVAQASRAQASGPLVVAADGSGQFRTVQAAIDAAPSQASRPVIIQLKPGTYHEKVTVPTLKTHLVLRGSEAATTVITVITYDDHVGQPGITTPGSYSVLVQANDFTAENVTFENAAGYAAGQAVALNVEGDRAIFRRCRMVGNQDVLLLATGGSRQYYKDCYIEGTTDFIFGASTGVFDHCEIKSKKNSFVTAASTPAGQAYGFVFLHCKLTADTTLAKRVYLGRPWRPQAQVVYLSCELGRHIAPAGWDNWKNADNEKTAYYAEYRSTGPGANPAGRVPWSHQLTTEEAKKYALKRIFAGKEPWQPR